MKDFIFVSTAALTQLAPTPVLAILATPLPAMDSVAQVRLCTSYYYGHSVEQVFINQFDSDNNHFHELLLLDVDECARGTAMCSHNCQDTPGSYTCSCRSGYALNVDGRTCESMNSYYCLLKESKRKIREIERENGGRVGDRDRQI